MHRRGSRGIGSARPVTLPAPFGGIDGRSPLSAMPARMAVDLVNWWPAEGALRSREGWAPLADLGTGAPVASLIGLHDGGGLSLAASAGRLFSVAPGGGVAELGAGFASDRWRSSVHADRLFLVNGEDAPQRFTGGTLEPAGFTGPGEVEALYRVTTHARRLFFAERGSARFWYGGLGAVQGELQPFDLAGVGARGGELVEIAALAADGGKGGADDALAFFLSSGDVIVYRGSNPGDAASWGLVGVFRAAQPIAATAYAGDVLVVSADGYAPLSRMLPSGRSPVEGFGDALGRVATEATNAHGRDPGWAIEHDPARDMILVHVPVTALRSEQHVLNLRTGGWGRWRGLPAVSWGRVGGDLCFGTTDGRIARLGGTADDGEPIVATAQGAWTQLGSPGLVKRAVMVRPVVSSVADPLVRHVIAADFTAPFFGAASTIPLAADAGRWDQHAWDEAVWGGTERITRDWRGGGAMGDFLSLGLRADTRSGALSWLSTTISVERGGVL